jgi:hypothetical protein
MTLLEAGYNLNRQKAFLRLLRNHSALAALPLHRKVELARFFVGAQLRVRDGELFCAVACCPWWLTMGR